MWEENRRIPLQALHFYSSLFKKTLLSFHKLDFISNLENPTTSCDLIVIKYDILMKMSMF